jgi:hypothetical protein
MSKALVRVGIASAALLFPGVAAAQSAGCNYFNSTGEQLVAMDDSTTNVHAAGERIAIRVAYDPNAGARDAFFRFERTLFATTRTFANSDLSVLPIPANDTYTSSWGRRGTDAGTTIRLRLTCQTAAPAITNLSSTSGPAGGGGTLTISGTNLGAATGVSFGTTPATIVGLPSNTAVTVNIPAGTGAQNVTVTDAIGTSGALTYTYTVPAEPVPTLSEWAMIILSLVLAGGAALYLQRQHQTA